MAAEVVLFKITDRLFSIISLVRYDFEKIMDMQFYLYEYSPTENLQGKKQMCGIYSKGQQIRT